MPRKKTAKKSVTQTTSNGKTTTKRPSKKAASKASISHSKKTKKSAPSKLDKSKSSFDMSMVRKHRDLPEGETLQFLGLIAPNGNPGGSLIGKQWTFSVTLQAWKVKGGSIVNEPAILVCRNLSEAKLDGLMKTSDVLKVVGFIAVVPKKSRKPKYFFQDNRFELIRFIRNSADDELEAVQAELQKPVIKTSKLFGGLKLNRNFESFETVIKTKGEDFGIEFRATSTEELEEMITYITPLWKQRSIWFKNWKSQVFQHYTTRLDGFWCGEGELTEKRFNDLLGEPVCLYVSRGKKGFGYQLSGYSEELFSDHGISAFGSTVDKMSVEF